MIVLTSKGRQLALDEACGSGGEGTVYRLKTAVKGAYVAKIYHQPPAPEQQEKIEYMIRSGTPALRESCAWPVETLHEPVSHRFRGYLMPELLGMEPLHHLYTPLHRLRHFPNTRWDFLLAVARNLCACLSCLHDHGLVVGDINPNVVFVGKNSRVCLIDTDSFQISNSNGKLWPCRVGSQHFTPPELQGDILRTHPMRTAQHDNFGLAVLLFHLLFMGRHPYSGQGKEGVHVPLEESIRRNHYVYAVKRKKGLPLPPKQTLHPVDLGPENLVNLFEQAFATPKRGQTKRPLPGQWHSVLQLVIDRLEPCPRHSGRHVYFRDLGACPWCAHEQRSGMSYFSTTPACMDTLYKEAEELTRMVSQLTESLPVRQFKRPTPETTSMFVRELRCTIWAWQGRLWVARLAWILVPFLGRGWIWATPLIAAWIYPGKLDLQGTRDLFSKEISRIGNEIQRVENRLMLQYNFPRERDRVLSQLQTFQGKPWPRDSQGWKGMKQEILQLRKTVEELSRQRQSHIREVSAAQQALDRLRCQEQLIWRDWKQGQTRLWRGKLFQPTVFELWLHDVFPFRS